MHRQAYQISFAGQERLYPAAACRSLLASLVAEGVDALSVGCRSGGCGVCRIQILDGEYQALPMNRARISEADEAVRIALACRIIPMSDLHILPLPPRGFEGVN